MPDKHLAQQTSHQAVNSVAQVDFIMLESGSSRAWQDLGPNQITLSELKMPTPGGVRDWIASGRVLNRKVTP
jgi:hypothetical protein